MKKLDIFITKKVRIIQPLAECETYLCVFITFLTGCAKPLAKNDNSDFRDFLSRMIPEVTGLHVSSSHTPNYVLG